MFLRFVCKIALITMLPSSGLSAKNIMRCVALSYDMLMLPAHLKAENTDDLL